ncbi:MAG: Mur ligase domain-containing protein, partial [Thiothrix litoralis]|uniref:Mur ligase domain-containing protein n=1 Tax=Thiothrix litoralis TaxID=2891210 RepID=UPI003C73F08C
MNRTLSLRTLLAGIVESTPDVQVSGLTLDNRHIQPGMAFVALRGTRQHGLSYAEAAVRAGASVVLFEPENGLQLPPLSVELVPVPSLREHLGTLADRF